jgi:hypothetical protein
VNKAKNSSALDFAGCWRLSTAKSKGLSTRRRLRGAAGSRAHHRLAGR